MIIEKFINGTYQEQCYIIGCEKTKKGIVIDPGGDVKDIISIINRLELKIEYIFNTHFHADHTGGNKALRRLTKAKLLMHKDDIPYLRQLFRGDKIATFRLSSSPMPDIIIDKEQSIKVGNIEFKIYHTPGHTPGGLCFYAEGKLFTGDTLFVGDSGATSFDGGDRHSLGMSLRRIMRELPGDTIIYPGHDYGPTPTSTLEWEKHNNRNAKEYGFYE